MPDTPSDSTPPTPAELDEAIRAYYKRGDAMTLDALRHLFDKSARAIPDSEAESAPQA